MKNFNTIKIKKYLKNYSLLIIANIQDQNSKNQKLIKQELNKLKINYYKNCNKVTKKIFTKSLYKNFINLIYNPFCFIYLKQNIITLATLKYLKNLKFIILGIKLNRKIYFLKQLEKLKTLSYKNEFSILYQFLLINLKLPQLFNNFSK